MTPSASEQVSLSRSTKKSVIFWADRHLLLVYRASCRESSERVSKKGKWIDGSRWYRGTNGQWQRQSITNGTPMTDRSAAGSQDDLMSMEKLKIATDRCVCNLFLGEWSVGDSPMSLQRVLETYVCAPLDRECDCGMEGVVSLASCLLCVPEDELLLIGLFQ
jgi:hypothetical protein